MSAGGIAGSTLWRSSESQLKVTRSGVVPVEGALKTAIESTSLSDIHSLAKARHDIWCERHVTSPLPAKVLCSSLVLLAGRCRQIAGFASIPRSIQDDHPEA